MNTQKIFYGLVRGFAAGGVIAQGLYYSTTQPSTMDVFSGLVAAAVICSLWGMKDSQ
jgi:hypothetical protein